MEFRNKLTMCRLCLCKNECFINIFEFNDWQGYVASKVISDLLQFRVSETDGFPHVVCFTCLTKLTDFKLFKEFCQKSKVTYERMFILSDSLVKHQPDVDIGIGGRLELFEQDPLKGETSDPIIKEEELDIDTSCNESDKRFEETKDEVTSGPILLKHEVLPFNSHIHAREKLIESEVFEDANEPSTSKEDSTQEEGRKGTVSEKGIGGRNDTFKCHYCGKLLTKKSSLIRHFASHGIGDFFKCDVCGRICVSKSKLKVHIRQHTGERPYECTDCSALFRNHSNLKAHMRIHANIKPFKCKECNLSFSQNSKLKSHMRLHSDSKPHSCGVCHAAFRHKSTLTIHLRTHSGDRPYKCTVCPKAFSDCSTLKKHQLVHSGERLHPCPHCSKRFSLRGNLKRHFKTVCVEKC